MKQIVFIFFLVISSNIFAQSEVNIYPANTKTEIDTSRIKDLSDQLSIYTYGIQKLYGIKFTHDNGKILELSPNGRTNFGFGFNYKWMGIGLAFKVPGSKNDDDIYGETSRLDFQLNVFTKSFALDFSTQYYKGYYVTNPELFTEWEGPEYPQLNNLETVSFNLSGDYFINHKKFSYRAAFVRNEIQKKSAGSLILGAYTRYDVATAPDGFIPEGLPLNLKDTFNIYNFKTINYGLSIGYAYTFVINKRIFLSLSLIPGFGSKTLVISTNKGISDNIHGLSTRFVSRVGLGYEHKHFYLGLGALSSLNGFKYQDLSVSTSTTKLRFYIGKRFNVRKKKSSN